MDDDVILGKQTRGTVDRKLRQYTCKKERFLSEFKPNTLLRWSVNLWAPSYIAARPHAVACIQCPIGSTPKEKVGKPTGTRPDCIGRSTSDMRE